MRRASLCVGLLVFGLLDGCAGERHAVPPAGSLTTPELGYDLLRGKQLAVKVVDQRSSPDFSDALVGTIQETVADALRRGSVVVDDRAANTLEIRVRGFHSELSRGEWKGCAALSTTLQLGERPEVTAFEQCVNRLDTDGTRSGDEAAAKALEDALALLLHHVDRMGR